jgi:hypothetical protein
MTDDLRGSVDRNSGPKAIAHDVQAAIAPLYETRLSTRWRRETQARDMVALIPFEPHQCEAV